MSDNLYKSLYSLQIEANKLQEELNKKVEEANKVLAEIKKEEDVK